MRLPTNEFSQLKRVLDSAEEILVVTGRQPTLDSLAAALSFYLALPQIGKRVTVVNPEPVTVDVSNLVGIDKISDRLNSSRNFIISLDYVEGSIEKVSYHIEGDKFNLVVEPRPGFSFSRDKVSLSHGNGSADLLITVAVPDMAQLGKLSQEIDSLLPGVDSVNIDIHGNNARYAKINLVFPGMGSISEVAVSLLKELNLVLDSDNASNLLSGVVSATENFTAPHTSPDSFEAAAYLLRAGAQKRGQESWSLVGRGSHPLGRGFTTSPQRGKIAVPSGAFSPLSPSNLPAVKQQSPPPRLSDDKVPSDWLKPRIFSSRDKKPPSPRPEFTPGEVRDRVS